MLRQILKTIFGIIVIALAIYGGIYAWFQIKTIENIRQTDIYEAIPANPNMILIVHKPALLPELWNVCNKFSNFLPEEKSLVVVDAIGKSQICSEQCIDKEPLAISYYPEGALLLSRMKLKDFEYMEKKFFKTNLSGFAPKKEMYKKAEISIKATTDESFFCYTLFHNIFIGSFEKKLIYKAIDAYIQQSGLRIDTTFNKEIVVAFDKFDKNTLAGLYLNNLKKSFIFKELTSDTLNHWLIGDIKIKDQTMEISGFLPANKQDTLFARLNFTPRMIPLNTSYFKYYFPGNAVDSILSPCIEKSTGFIQFTGNDSIHSNREALIFQSSCTEKSFEKNAYFISLHEDYIIASRTKESVEDYLTSIKEEKTFEHNPVFQAIFKKHYNNDVHKIVWMRKEFPLKKKSAFYDFLLFVSPNHADKFYSLSIVREP